MSKHDKLHLDHRLSFPCVSADTLRTDLERRALDFIAARAAARLSALDADRKELEQQRDVLKARIRLARRGGQGVEPSADGEALSASLKKCEDRLTELAGDLGDRVAIVAETLAEPEKQLQLAVHTLRLDQMNFVVEAGDAACAEGIFVEATASEELSRVLVPVHLSRRARGAMIDRNHELPSPVRPIGEPRSTTELTQPGVSVSAPCVLEQPQTVTAEIYRRL